MKVDEEVVFSNAWLCARQLGKLEILLEAGVEELPTVPTNDNARAYETDEW